MRAIFVLLGILIVAGAVAGGAYFLLSGSSSPPFATSASFDIGSSLATSSAVTTVVASTITKRDVPKGSLEYQSTPHHFSILYPENLTVSKRESSGNAVTITFEDVTNAQGFQIYIVPYQQLQVSEVQFKKDVPSGVRTDMQNITVDGATGASFHSKDANLGDTSEVWFVREGWLYEVTTLKPLEAWLEPILKTWKFM